MTRTLESLAKQLRREQAEGRKAKAVRFVRDVLGDPDRAAEIEDEDLESYADRRHFEIINPKASNTMASNKELQQRVKELEAENQDLSDQLDAIADIVGSDEDEDEDEDDDEGED